MSSESESEGWLVVGRLIAGNISRPAAENELV